MTLGVYSTRQLTERIRDLEAERDALKARLTKANRLINRFRIELRALASRIDP